MNIEDKLKDYTQSGFTPDQLDCIRQGLEQGLDVSIYANPEFGYYQMKEILLGLEEGLDVTVYAKEAFTAAQMEMIRIGLERGLDEKYYANPEFDVLQIGEIQLGLEEGLDVTKYADPKINQKKMRQIRIDLHANTNKSKSSHHKDIPIDNLALWNLLKGHLGHRVEIAVYGDPESPTDVVLEDMDTNEVILDSELYTLQERNDIS